MIKAIQYLGNIAHRHINQALSAHLGDTYYLSPVVLRQEKLRDWYHAGERKAFLTNAPSGST